MGSNIIELAKLGHERAAELKASCGAVDVRSLAQLISDLATQLEVQLVRGNEQAVQLANAESKRRELASEVSELSECKNLLEKIKSTSCHVDTSKDAVIPNSLDAWGRPVPQYLPYDFSGNPGASATQYCNGWNDAGGYWLNHVKYLQECIRINNSFPEAAQ
ncbi:hypothetical protein HX52_23050 [Salmonella enterica]|nr:hypothetical protein [Salmonella enterica]EBL7699458.1 hypothetical protein [Salmonella enterica]